MKSQNSSPTTFMKKISYKKMELDSRNVSNETIYLDGDTILTSFKSISTILQLGLIRVIIEFVQEAKNL